MPLKTKPPVICSLWIQLLMALCEILLGRNASNWGHTGFLEKSWHLLHRKYIITFLTTRLLLACFLNSTFLTYICLWVNGNTVQMLSFHVPLWLKVPQLKQCALSSGSLKMLWPRSTGDSVLPLLTFCSQVILLELKSNKSFSCCTVILSRPCRWHSCFIQRGHCHHLKVSAY